MKYLLRLALVLGLPACGTAASCPEPTTPSTTSATTTSAARPDLFAELEVPASMAVMVDAEGRALDMRHVFNGFGCTGENHSPAISWSGAPEGTQSYLLEIHDPDAPTGVGFFHWIVADIPTSVTSLPFDAAASAMPEGVVQTRTDFGGNTYGGPCPPAGPPHRYNVTIYALDVPQLGVDAGASAAVVRFMSRGHTLAYGRATVIYGQPE